MWCPYATLSSLTEPMSNISVCTPNYNFTSNISNVASFILFVQWMSREYIVHHGLVHGKGHSKKCKMFISSPLPPPPSSSCSQMCTCLLVTRNEWSNYMSRDVRCHVMPCVTWCWYRVTTSVCLVLRVDLTFYAEVAVCFLTKQSAIWTVDGILKNHAIYRRRGKFEFDLQTIEIISILFHATFYIIYGDIVI